MHTLDDSLKVVFNSYYRVKNSLHGYDSDLRDLTGIRTVFERAGIPRQGIPTIVVTGSKGKGSTAILCSAFLQEMGLKVGLVTSPHLIEFRERIRLNGIAIPETEFVSRIMALEPIVTQVDSELTRGYISPTGVILAAAMQYFIDKQVDAIVLEAGRGGRFDDVQIIDNSVSCLTPIMPEHLDKLGPTIRNVAWHKAGIIKYRSWVISAPQTREVLPILMDEIIQQAAQPLMVGTGINYTHDVVSQIEQNVHVQVPTLSIDHPFKLRSPAKYLALNAALGLSAAAVLISPPDNQMGKIGQLTPKLRFSGRCDIVHNNPTVVIDGAINRESANALLDSVIADLQHPTILVAALPDDKDDIGFLETLMPHADKTIITTATNTNLTFTTDVVEHARMIDATVIYEPDVHRALQLSEELAGREGFVLAAGTQSFVRDALVYWKQDLNSIWVS